MINQIKAEFRKFYSLTSMLLALAFLFALVILISFYVLGYKIAPTDMQDPHKLMNNALGAVSFTAVLLSILSILHITLEYRHNTILYTITSSKSRTRIFIAKIIVVSVLALVVGALVLVLSPALSLLGTHLHGGKLAHQEFYFVDTALRGLYFMWAHAAIGLVLGFLLRSQVIAIASMFFLPVIENILSLLLHENSVYLPFTALQQVIPNSGVILGKSLTFIESLSVFGLYLVAAGAVSLWLFNRRDAN